MKKINIYNQIVHDGPFGYALHEIILDETEKPCDYRFIEVNKAFERLTELSSVNITGKTVKDVFSQNNQGKFDFTRFYSEVSEKGTPIEIEKYFEQKNRWYRIEAFSPAPNLLSTIFTDITNLKQSKLHDETPLKLSGLKRSEIINTIIEAMPDMIFVMHRNGSILEIFGADPDKLIASADDLIGVSIKDCFAIEEFKRHLNIYEHCIFNNEIGIIEFELTINNKILSFESRVKPLDDERLLTIVRDISEHKKAEEIHRERERQYINFLDSLSDSVYVLDPEWRHVIVNEAATRFVQMPREKLLGNKLTELFPGIENSDFFKTFEKVMETREPDNVTGEYIFEDGRKGWYEVQIDPVPEGILCISRDITKRKQAEEAVLESEKRYAFLAQTAIELFELDSTKDIYAYTAHRINQLLNNQSIVAVVEYNHVSNRWKMQHLEGEEKMIIKITKILGFDIKRMEGEISTKYYKDIISGNLVEMKFDFLGLFNDKVSGAIGKVVKKVLSVKKMYCIAFQQNKHTYGNITFVTNDKTGLIDANLIEAFVNQVSNFVKRQKAEKELQSNYSLLQIAGKTAKFGSWSVDRATDIVTWSDAVSDIHEVPHGYTPKVEEAISFYAPEWREMITNALSACAEKGIPYDKEMEIITSKRKRKWIRTTGEAIKDEQGNIILIQGSFQDISEHKWAEKALLQEKEWSENIVNNAPNIIVGLGEKSKIIVFNHYAERLTGYKAEEVIGKEWIKVFIPGEHKERIYQIWDEILDNKLIDHQFENYIVTKSSEKRLIEWKNTILTEKGEFRMILSIGVDITERKRAETARTIQYNIARSIHSVKDTGELLETIKTELRKLFDTSNFIVAMYDPVKETLKKLLYIDEKDDFTEWPADKSLSGFVVKSGKSLLLKRQEIESFARENKLELVGTTATCWLGVPFSIKKNNAGVIVIQSYDNAEAYNSNDVALLEMIAHEIGVYLEKQMMIDDVIKAKEKAEESNRLKTAFMNNISHEIRTPLNGILGFSEFIIEEGISPNVKLEYYNTLKQSSERLQQTITDILDISQIVAGTIKPNISQVYIGTVMNSMFETTKYACSKKNIQVSLDIPKYNENTLLQTDEELLIKIMSHLLSNAEKFTSAGRINMGYDIKDNWVLFFVKDTGKGIEEDKLSIIFNPFIQEDSSITRGYEGSGLGLSITRGFVELLGGSLWVESKKSKGSTFFFTLPLLYGETKTKPEIKITTKPQAYKNPLVLIAEDDESNSRLLQVVIQKAGFSTLLAYNGAEAVELCHQYPEIALIIMDIKMPLMNGMEATALIKSFRPSIPIVALTAHTQTGEKQRILESGCDEYLAKPVKLQELKELIKKLNSQESIY